MHLNCIIVISYNAYLACKFLGNFIQQNTKSAFPKKSGKIVTTAHRSKLYSQKLYQCQNKYIACNILNYSMQSNSRQNYLNNFEKKTEQQRSLLRYVYPNCIIVISNDTYFVYKFLCNFIHQKSKSAYPKNSGEKYDYNATC